MSTEITDTQPGADGLSIEQAAAAYAKATATKEAPPSQSEAEDEGESTTDDELQASEEDVSEEDGGEPDDEGEAGDGSEDEPDSEEGRFVASNGKVRLPTGEVVTVQEAAAGYLKERDYRQKTMETAELRKSAEAQSAAYTQKETQLNEQRDQMVQLLRSIVPQAPDPSLASTDPYAYTQQKAAHEAWIGHLQALEQQGQKAKQQKDEESAKSKQEKGEAEWATLIEKAPGLKDPKRFESFARDVADHGKAYGFTPAELAEALGYDHRQALVMRDAIAWRKLQASKPKVQAKVEGRPPIAKGGKRLNPAEHRARGATEAIAKAKSSGRLEDVAAAYYASRKG